MVDGVGLTGVVVMSMDQHRLLAHDVGTAYQHAGYDYREFIRKAIDFTYTLKISYCTIWYIAKLAK